MLIFQAVLRTHLRQFLRQRSFWIIQALLASPALLLAVIIGLNPNSNFDLGFAVPGLGMLALYYLVMPIVTAPLVLRNLGQIGEFLWSSPLDALAHFAGEYLGGWLGLLLATVIQLGAWFLADLVFPNMFGAWIWLVSLGVYLVANTLGLALITLLVKLLRRMLPVVVGWAALWLWLFVQVIFSEGLSESFQPMQNSVFINIFFHHLQLSPSLGLGLGQGRILSMAGWFLGLSLAILGAAVMVSFLADPRRATRLRWAPVGLLVVGMLAAAGGAYANLQAVTAHRLEPSPYDPQIDKWGVTAQETHVTVEAGSGWLSGETRLVLAPLQTPERPEIVLRLNAGLELSAADEAGEPLAASRAGDSYLVELPEIPSAPVTLNLRWEGRLQYPYATFEQFWKHSTAPFPYPYTHMPQRLDALLVEQGGYLLRDGDWMPWVWVSTAHIAGQNLVEVQTRGGAPVAPIPLENGKVTYTGTPPEVLLAFLPDQKTSLGSSTIASSPLVGAQQLARAQVLANAARSLADLAGETAPRYVIVAPYLSRLIWNGDLLLIPDGGGEYISLALAWFYWNDALNTDQAQFNLVNTAYLARTWLHNHLPPAERGYQPVLHPAGSDPQAGSYPNVDEWVRQNGVWVQAVENLDVETSWDPRRVLSLTPAGEWSAVGFWLALALSDEQARQANLDFTREYYELRLAGERRLTDPQQEQLYRLSWNEYMETMEAQALVLDLYGWSERVGMPQALQLAFAAYQETQPVEVETWLNELEQRSGIPVEE